MPPFSPQVTWQTCTLALTVLRTGLSALELFIVMSFVCLFLDLVSFSDLSLFFHHTQIHSHTGQHLRTRTHRS